jgi:hypothetical protein
MKLRSARSAQQMRLWVYCVLLVLVVLGLWTGRAGFPEFLTFCLIGALFYMEICPVCGRLCWWELHAVKKWPNALWIGPECRRRPAETDRCSSDVGSA